MIHSMEALIKITVMAYAAFTAHAYCSLIIKMVQGRSFTGVIAGIILWPVSIAALAVALMPGQKEIASCACLAGVLVLQLIIFWNSANPFKPDSPLDCPCRIPSVAGIALSVICFAKSIFPLLTGLVPVAAAVILTALIIAAMISGCICLFIYVAPLLVDSVPMAATVILAILFSVAIILGCLWLINYCF